MIQGEFHAKNSRLISLYQRHYPAHDQKLDQPGDAAAKSRNVSPSMIRGEFHAKNSRLISLYQRHYPAHDQKLDQPGDAAADPVDAASPAPLGMHSDPAQFRRDRPQNGPTLRSGGGAAESMVGRRIHGGEIPPTVSSPKRRPKRTCASIISISIPHMRSRI